MSGFRTICFFTSLVFLFSCATMNQSECVNANWKIVGMEDGAKGRALAYLSNHRKACAEYNVTPDYEDYRIGHAEGLRQYCTYSNGFYLGERGRSMNDFCPDDLAGQYKLGYENGRQVYYAKVEINRVRSTIKEKSVKIDQLEEAVATKEEIILSGQASKNARALLLEEVKEMHAQIQLLEEELQALEVQESAMVEDLELLKRL